MNLHIYMYVHTYIYVLLPLRGRNLTWYFRFSTSGTMQGAFDLILGCDLLYNTKSHSGLVSTLRKLATQSNAPVYLAYPQRHPGKHEFIELARLHFEVGVEDIGDGWVTSEGDGLYGKLEACRLQK